MSLATIVTWQSAAAAPGNKAPWSGELTIRACEVEPLEMPKGAANALQATLLVKAGTHRGSAVLVSPDAFALTAAHVVGDHERVAVITDRRVELEATVVRVDERSDVALIHVNYPVDAPCLAPVAERAPIGADIFVLGSPGGEELAFSLAKGIVSGYRKLEGLAFVQLDASVNPGNSGGPVVDALGGVVGLASWKISHVSMEGLAFAVPIHETLRALQVSLGEETDPSWASRGGRRLQEPRLDGRRVDARRPEAPRSPSQAKPASRRGLSRGQTALIASGSVVGGLGLVAILATAGTYWTTEEMSPGSWDTLVGLNIGGWVAASAGAILLGSGVIWVAVDDDGVDDVAVVFGPQSLTVMGAF